MYKRKVSSPASAVSDDTSTSSEHGGGREGRLTTQASGGAVAVCCGGHAACQDAGGVASEAGTEGWALDEEEFELGSADSGGGSAADSTAGAVPGLGLVRAAIAGRRPARRQRAGLVWAHADSRRARALQRSVEQQQLELEASEGERDHVAVDLGDGDDVNGEGDVSDGGDGAASDGAEVVGEAASPPTGATEASGACRAEAVVEGQEVCGAAAATPQREGREVLSMAMRDTGGLRVTGAVGGSSAGGSGDEGGGAVSAGLDVWAAGGGGVGRAEAMSVGTSAATGDAVSDLQPVGSGRKRTIEEAYSGGEQPGAGGDSGATVTGAEGAGASDETWARAGGQGDKQVTVSADVGLAGAVGGTEGRKSKRGKQVGTGKRQAFAKRRAAGEQHRQAGVGDAE